MRLLLVLLLLPFIGMAQDTTYTTYQVQHDTLLTTTIPDQITCRDTSYEVFDTSYNTFYQLQLYATVDGSIIATFEICDTIPAHDTTFVCSMCAVHDTTIMVITPETDMEINGILVGIESMTLAQKINYAISYSCNALRTSHDPERNNWQIGAIKDAGLFSLMTYNTSPVGQPTDAFPTAAEIPWHVNFLDSLLNDHIDELPDIITFQNEEPNTNYWSGPPQDYVRWLNAAAAVAHKYNIPCSNGGLLQNVVYYIRWVYQQEGKTDSVNLINQLANLGPNTGTAAQHFIDWYKVEIPAIAASTLDYVDFHCYEPSLRNDPNRTTASGIIPIIVQFLRSRTGKTVITSEFGTDNPSQNLFNETADDIDGSGVHIRFYYSGDGNVAENHPQYWEDWINQNSP